MNTGFDYHSWNLSPKEAIALQKELAKCVVVRKIDTPLNLVAGVDCAFSKDGTQCIAVAALWDLEQKKLLEFQSAQRALEFPYIPGLLSFREAPTMLDALAKLTRQPEIIMVDGHGIAHPRALGIAAHIGVITQMPTLGCAKSLLCGTFEPLEQARGALSKLYYHGNQVGVVLRTRTAVRPVFVSIGNQIDLETATKIVLDCSLGYRLPEPTRYADKLVALTKKGLS